jgi:acetyl-CoA acyltransferase
MKKAYIIDAKRTPVGKVRGLLSKTRADDLLIHAIQSVLKSSDAKEEINKNIDDIIVGCAMPEGPQGLNIARIATLLAGLPDSTPAYTLNRFCSSGLQSVSNAADLVKSGSADLVIAAGVESMSSVPMTGYKPELNYDLIKAGHKDYYWGMGNTAEAVAKQFKVCREDQDEFAYNSHMKSLRAQAENRFQDQIVPIKVVQNYIDVNGKKATKSFTVNKDEGPRAGTNIEALAKLRPVFAAGGSVTAGNSSQMSDGAAFVMVMSETMVKELNLKPIARLVNYAAAGVEPRIMGIGPVKAIPKALNQAGLKQGDLSIIELNEAFASQSLAVIRELDLNPEIINPNGGAISLGHPLGCTGAKLSVQLFDEMRRQEMQGKFGAVTMCVGTGQGACGIFEFLN